MTLAWPPGTSGSTTAGGQSLQPSVFRGSRSGDFPAPSMALGRCRPGPRGVSASAALPGEIDPHDLCLAFRALATLLEPATSRRTGTGLLLSWSCPLVASSPYSTCASTPEWRPETPLFGPVVPRTDLVPPSWFLTTSTACSAQGLRVCCTPLPALRFIAFLTTCPRRFRRSHGRESAIPAMWAHTLRRVPLAGSRTASLRPLPSCRCRALTLPYPGGLGCLCPEGRWRASRRGLCVRVRVGDDAPIRLGEPPRRLQYRLPSRRNAWMVVCACPCRAFLTWDLRCRPSRRWRALESSRLQGLAPPTSPLPPRHRRR
jgi:hypothetical protein